MLVQTHWPANALGTVAQLWPAGQVVQVLLMRLQHWPALQQVVPQAVWPCGQTHSPLTGGAPVLMQTQEPA